MTDYFSEKIDRACGFFEAQAKKVNAAYLADVEKLAKRTHDLTLADFYRMTAKPSRIISRIQTIRSLLETGDIVGADQELERLRTDLYFVEDRLRNRYFRTGIDLSNAGKKGSAQRARSKQDRNVEMAIEYVRRLPKKGSRSTSALKAEIGSRWKLKRSQAIDAINNGLKKLSGSGG